MPPTQCKCNVFQPKDFFVPCPVYNQQEIVDMLGRFGFGQRYGSRDIAGLPWSFDFSGPEAMLGHPLSI